MTPLFIKRILSLLNLVNVYDDGPGLYKGPAVKDLDDFFELFCTGENEPDLLSQKINEWAHNIDLIKELEPWLERNMDSHLSLRVRPRRKTRINLYYLPPHTSHPPHSHHHLSSIQILIKGRLQLREFATVHSNEKLLKLKQVNQCDLVPYETFLTSEDYRSVHWFGTYDEPAIILSYNVNFGILGKFNLSGRRINGRYYVDTRPKASKEGVIDAPRLPDKEALDNFSGSIQKFPKELS